jgi:hypothetical protein
MNKKKFVILMVSTLVCFSVLSGCLEVFTVFTEGWENMNTEATAVRIWGRLSLLQAPDNWEEGFVWDTEKHDDLDLYAHKEWATWHTGFNTYYLDIEDLDRTTTYHYRAFAEYQGPNSKVYHGIDRTFLPGRPVVHTLWATDVELNSAILRGNLGFMGGASSCEVFFVYGDDPDLMLDETPHQTLTSTGDFNASLTNLEKCVTIYYKAVAINDVDTTDGLILNVTPGQAGVETYLPPEVGIDYAVFKGKLWHLGGVETCEVWFEYGDDSPNNLDENTTHQTMNTTGEFTAYVGGLKSGTTYWFRAVADNAECGIAYGSIKEFKTDSGEKTDAENTRPKTTAKSIMAQIYNWLKNLDNKTFEKLIERHPLLERLLPLYLQ